MAFILDSVCTKITFAFTIPVVASRSAFIILTHSIGCSTLSVSVIPSCSAICFTSRKNISLPVYQYPQDSRSTFRLSADSCRISVYADGYIAGVVALISLWAYSHRPARVSSLTKATDTAKAVSVAFGRGFKDLNLPLENIVALLAWSASHCSLFSHLTALPFPAAGSGKALRPGTRACLG